MATSYFSVREVKDDFETLIQKNTTALRELDGAVQSVQSDKATIDEAYTRGLDKFVSGLLRPMDSAAIKRLSFWATGERDFEAEYNARMTARNAAEIRVNALTATHGSAQTLQKKVEGFTENLATLEAEAATLTRRIDSAQLKLQPVNGFNARAAQQGKAQLTAETIDYFSSKKGLSHAWSFLFDSHYRQGRGLIKSFATSGTDSIPATQAALVTDSASYQATDAAHQDISSQKAATVAVLTDIRTTNAQVVSESTLRDRMKAEIIAAFEDTTYFNRVAKEMSDRFPKMLTEQRAKIENLRQLQDSAQKTIKSVRAANAKLDVHMPKLRKAASRAGSKQISIDLNGIKTSFKTMHTSVTRQTTQVKQRSAAVRDYRFSASTPAVAPAGGMADPVNIMMMVMIMDMHTPSVDVSVPDVGGSFNDAVGHIDVGNIDVSVPDIAVPDISVPDFSVPDVSSFSSGFDGGGGGFDGGGF